MQQNENQLHRLFDFETGQEIVESAQRVLEAQEALILEQAANVEAMMATAGWKYIEDFVYRQIESGKEKLVDAKDLDEIRRIQSQITAFSHLLGAVDSLIREAAGIRAAKTKDEETR